MGQLWLHCERKGDGGYRVMVQAGPQWPAVAIDPVPIGPDAEISLGGRTLALAAVLDALGAFDLGFLEAHLDERGQLDLGRHLYRGTLAHWVEGGRPLPDDADRRLRVRYAADDDHAIALPWVLLADDRGYLAARGWSVELCGPGTDDEVQLPPSPRLLIAAPRPGSAGETQREDHLRDLEALLSAADPGWTLGHKLQVVHTLAALQAALRVQHYPAFYFYGHGAGSRRRSRLVFEDEQGGAVQVPMEDLAQILAGAQGGPPRLAYINCCKGDAGAALGVGAALGRTIPAVITNRTTAYVTAARAQALALWESLLLAGEPPHRALADIYNRLPELGLSFGNERWLNPVLHARYDRWHAQPPGPDSELDRKDPHWRLKLDRRRQIAQATFDVKAMLHDQAPRCLFYCWYGSRGQGVGLFQRRLTHELEQEHGAGCVWPVTPLWPDHWAGDDPFAGMLAAALHLRHLDQLPAQVRAQIRAPAGRPRLLYLRHTPIDPDGLPDLDTLARYFEWCDRELVPLLARASAFAVVAVPKLLAPDRRGRTDAGFPAAMQAAIDRHPPGQSIAHLLEGLEAVDKRDLKDFLVRLKIGFPPGRLDPALDDILRRTGGRFEDTLDALEEAVARRSAVPAADAGPSTHPAAAGQGPDRGVPQ